MKPAVKTMGRSQCNVVQDFRPRRFSVSAESIQPKDHLLLNIVPKSIHEEAIIRAATLDRFVFMLLDSDQYDQVVQVMSKKRVPKYSVIAQQGDYADKFYIVESGVVDYLLDGVNAGQHGAGEGFGDLSLLHNERWSMSYVAAKDVVLWEVDRVTFRMIMIVKSVRQRQGLRELLSKIPFFSTLEQEDRYRVADVLRKVKYQDGDVVVHKDIAGEDTIFIIDHGTAVIVSDDNQERSGSIVTKGDCFGVLPDGTFEKVTVIAQGPLTCVTLSTKALYRVLADPLV